MQQPLINHSPDLKRLEEEGYDLEVIGGQYLIVHHIPYVNASKQVQYGSIICALTLASPTRAAKPPDHTAYFMGDAPCEANGLPLTAIINNSQTQALALGVIVNHYFSSKPVSGNYNDYYDKIRTYSSIISAHAQAIDKTVTARPHRSKETVS